MADITYFQTTDNDGNVMLKPRCQPTSESKVKRMVVNGRPQRAIDDFIELLAECKNWEIYDAWATAKNDYELECSAVEAYNENPKLDDNGQPMYRQFPNEPAPLSFAPVTADDVRAELASELKISSRKHRDDEISNIIVTVDGMDIDADERSRDLMSQAVIVLSDKPDGTTTPWKDATNTWQQLTKEQFKQAIELGGVEQTIIMQQYD